MGLKDKSALIKRWIGIATGKNRVAVRQDVGKYYKLDKVAGYYNDLTVKVDANTLLDDNGIPVNEIAGGTKVYFPISIFQYALGLWDLSIGSIDENKEYQKHFLKLCGWILDNQQSDGSWDCFSPIGYQTQSVSAMGQGEATSVLIRAYQLTGEEKWLSGAEKAVEFMFVPVNKGGVLRRDGENVFLEEYPGGNGEKLSVLNGWIFSVFGLYDYLLVREDEKVRELFECTVKTMASCLDKYDTGYWSYYDQTGRIASPAYHQLHISLLKVMGEITGKFEFLTVSEKWEKYESERINGLKAVIEKILQKFGDNPEGILVK